MEAITAAAAIAVGRMGRLSFHIQNHRPYTSSVCTQ
jgi:hypothetical protein